MAEKVEPVRLDPRAIGVKFITIDGKTYPVSVLPPGPEYHNDVVWADRSRPHYDEEEPLAYFGLRLLDEIEGNYA